MLFILCRSRFSHLHPPTSACLAESRRLQNVDPGRQSYLGRWRGNQGMCCIVMHMRQNNNIWRVLPPISSAVLRFPLFVFFFWIWRNFCIFSLSGYRLPNLIWISLLGALYLFTWTKHEKISFTSRYSVRHFVLFFRNLWVRRFFVCRTMKSSAEHVYLTMKSR